MLASELARPAIRERGLAKFRKHEPVTFQRVRRAGYLRGEGPESCGSADSGRRLLGHPQLQPEPARWDYGDWHHAVIGVQLSTDAGPVTLMWSNTFHPYGVEVFDDPIERI